MPAEHLGVWLHGERVGDLRAARGRLRFTYAPEALDRHELHTPLVSVSMPVSDSAYPHRIAWPFFDGLLPEGDARRMLAFDFGIAEDHTFGLLAELGRECAGALVIMADANLPREPAAGTAEPIDDAEVSRRLAELRTFPLGVDARVRVSLAGLQGKLLLTRTVDGRWALPASDDPSTHILKPPGSFPHMVENEAFCLAVARNLGIPVARAEVRPIGGQNVLVVERFDRELSPSGIPVRVHQEDTCQALSVPTVRKYEEGGGPSFARIAGVLRRWHAPDEDADLLVKIVMLSVLVGNADLHGKNLALLHDRIGGIRLAPLYDVMSTRVYPEVSTTMGMFVHRVRDVDAVTPADVIAEAETWGVAVARTGSSIEHLLERMPAAIEAAATEVAGVPDDLIDLLASRARAARDALAEGVGRGGGLADRARGPEDRDGGGEDHANVSEGADDPRGDPEHLGW